MGGKTSAGMLFRLGFGTVAALLLATVLLHHQLCVPRLPWTGEESNGPDDVLFWGVAAAAGVATYGLCLVKVRPSWSGLLHKMASVFVLWAFYKYLSVASLLYFPSVYRPWTSYIPGLEDLAGDP